MNKTKELGLRQPYIFDQYRKNNLKLIPLNTKEFELGEVKYLPPASKEWKNTIYLYNNNNQKNLPQYDLRINSLIKSYFSSYFNHLFIKTKYRFRWVKRLSMNKIYTSNAEVKHTNSKVIITVYTYNREKVILLNQKKEIQKLTKKIRLPLFEAANKYFSILKLLNKWDKKIYENNKKKNKKIKAQISKEKKLYVNGTLVPFFFFVKSPKFSSNLYAKNYLIAKAVAALFIKELKLIRRYTLRSILNKSKFEEKFLYILSSLISKYYNKKVEFNIVNMKSIILNSDIFTQILTKKIQNKKYNVIGMMNTILNRAVLPRVNRIVEKSYEIKSVNFNLLENKYLNPNINYVLKNTEDKDLDSLLNKNFYNVSLDNNSYNEVYNILFNSIKYKNMGGIRLEVNGRLTKRYRADRAQHKLRWKGGLKNIDSSYKRLSSVNKLGYLKANVEYSIFTSKRRIGSFAVKGWIGGK